MAMFRLLFFGALCLAASGQTVSTIVGGGPKSLPALQTGLGYAHGIAIDNAGSIYLASSYFNQIWKINGSGQVSIFAGNGSYVHSGDGGPAINAGFHGVGSMAFDAAGNLYVACLFRVRKIAPSGIITTVAGNGVDGSANGGNGGQTGDGGPATSAQLAGPAAIALDTAGSLYLSDGGKIRIVSSAGIISTFAGTGISGFSGDGGQATAAQFDGPSALTIDTDGSVYVVDTNNQRIRRLAGGTITTVAGSLDRPRGVAVDQYHNLFILEYSAIREIANGQSTVSTYAGSSTIGYSNGTSYTNALFVDLIAITIDASGSRILVLDQSGSIVRQLAAGVVSAIAGNRTGTYVADGTAGTDAILYQPTGVATNNAGTVYFMDSSISGFRTIPVTLAAPTTTGAQFVIGSGFLSTTILDPSPTQLTPTAITLDSSGVVYAALGNSIRKFSAGSLSTIVQGGSLHYGFSGDGFVASNPVVSFAEIHGLAIATNGDLYVADMVTGRVRRIAADTGIVTTVAGNGQANSSGDGGLATNASLNYPYGIALDSAGNLFVAEKRGNRIRKIALNTNIITTYAGDGSTTFADGVAANSTGVATPYGLTVDQSGNLFIASSGRIRRVDVSTGRITTVAGDGTGNLSGDGGNPLAAGMSPVAVTLDKFQNLYFTDSNGRIRTFPVASCFFTLGSPNYFATRYGGTVTMSVTATYSSCPYSVASSSPFVAITSGGSGMGSGTITFSVSANTGLARTASVSVGGTSFTVSQSGSQANVGFFQPNGPTWALDSNGSAAYDSGDKFFSFTGQPGAVAVVGDWNGDGRSKVGVYINGFWLLDYNGNGIYEPGIDKFYAFGGTGYTPVVGDWSGSGTTKIGFYYNGFWALDYNGDGTYNAGDKFYALGGNGAGEVPVVGDWNGSGTTKIGFFYNGIWALDYNGDGAFTAADKYYANFSYLPGDKPMVGDWSGSGSTKIGLYRNGFWVLDYNGNGTFESGVDKFYGFGGNTGEVPLVADWNGDGRTKVGVYVNGFWLLDYNGNGAWDDTSTDRFIAYYGGVGSQPIIGKW